MRSELLCIAFYRLCSWLERASQLAEWVGYALDPARESDSDLRACWPFQKGRRSR